MKRQEFSKRTKLQAWERDNGICGRCKLPIVGERADFDHIIPDTFSHDCAVDNCMPVHIRCHRQKTSEEDIPRIAKSNRVRAKHLGISRRSSFQTNRDGRWKRKMNGEIIRR